jgi:hypothetical protein
MINNVLFLAYEILFYFLLRVLRYYYYYYYYYHHHHHHCIFPGVFRIQLKKIKICGGARDYGKITSSSWSAKVCPGLRYGNKTYSNDVSTEGFLYSRS